MLQSVGLLNTLPGLTFAYLSVTLPICTWMVATSLRDIPVEIEEAARSTAAATTHHPEHRPADRAPGIVTAGIFAFVLRGRSTSSPCSTRRRRAQTAPVLMYYLLGQHQIDYARLMAAAVLLSIPSPCPSRSSSATTARDDRGRHQGLTAYLPAFIREQPAGARPQRRGRACVASHGSRARSTASRWSAPAPRSMPCRWSGPSFVAARRGPVGVHEPEDFVPESAISRRGRWSSSCRRVARARPRSGPRRRRWPRVCGRWRSRRRRGAAGVVRRAGAPPAGRRRAGGAEDQGLHRVVGDALRPRRIAGRGGVRRDDRRRAAAMVEPARGRRGRSCRRWPDVDALVVAGRRAHHGIALEASLKIAEMSGLRRAAFPTEEFLHRRLHGVTPRSIAFVIAEGDGEIAEAERASAAMGRRGCRVLIVDPPAHMAGRARCAAAPGARWASCCRSSGWRCSWRRRAGSSRGHAARRPVARARDQDQRRTMSAPVPLPSASMSAAPRSRWGSSTRGGAGAKRASGSPTRRCRRSKALADAIRRARWARWRDERGRPLHRGGRTRPCAGAATA